MRRGASNPLHVYLLLAVTLGFYLERSEMIALACNLQLKAAQAMNYSLRQQVTQVEKEHHLVSEPLAAFPARLERLGQTTSLLRASLAALQRVKAQVRHKAKLYHVLLAQRTHCLEFGLQR